MSRWLLYLPWQFRKAFALGERHTAGNPFICLFGLETKVYICRTSQVGPGFTMWPSLALQKSSYLSFLRAGIISMSHNTWLWKHCLIAFFWDSSLSFLGLATELATTKTKLGDDKHRCIVQRWFFFKFRNQDDIAPRACGWPAQRLWCGAQTMGLKVEMMIKIPVVSMRTGCPSPSNYGILGRLPLLCTDSIWAGRKLLSTPLVAPNDWHLFLTDQSVSVC